MITNILATVVISVITNWVDVYDTIDTWIIPCNSTVINTVATWPLSDSRYTKGKYIGKDGTVIELTEIKFNYKDAPQIHRIETEL